jgi:transposase
VWVLTVSADGAVPIAYRVEAGNTTDDVTHIGTWDGLVALVGRSDFLCVADCKLANREAMDHIATRGGRFVTVLPRSRREDKAFRAQWPEDSRVRRARPAARQARRGPPGLLGPGGRRL